MSGRKSPFNPPYNLIELLGQFAGTKEHLMKAGGELLKAFGSALGTIIDISQGQKDDSSSSKSKEEIKEVEIK